MGKKVLIAPLHWGLGHATRCIPIIRDQLAQGMEVLIAAEAGPKALLEEHFPEIRFVLIPFMEITYPADGNMSRHFFWRGPRLLLSIWREHQFLQKLIKAEHIEVVISDSRFGLWSKKAHSIFVTHQVEIKSPHFQGLINVLNRWVMSHYDEVWIPDYHDFPGLAGELSHPTNIPNHAKYIGPLSRFNHAIEKREIKWKAVALISGPEPQRSLFEAEIARRFIESEEPALILRGKPNEPETRDIGNLRIVHHLNDQTLLEELSQAEFVIARSGYSTIMDLHTLKIPVEYHPTPGQTEQEYLAQLCASGNKLTLSNRQ
ncbi:MAG: glycosyltransferase [Flavobacteriales bacterium]